LKRTPLYDKHISLNAKMVPFAGYSMPMSYTGIIDEHNAVRNMIGVLMLVTWASLKSLERELKVFFNYSL